MPGLVSCPIQLLPGMQQCLKPYLVRVCWWSSPPLIQFSGRMLAWSFWVQFFRHSSCHHSEFKEITVFYQQPCNAPELQPGPGLKEGYLKSKRDGGKRERPLASPSESIYEQSAAMNPGAWAPGETSPAPTKPTGAKATPFLVSEQTFAHTGLHVSAIHCRLPGGLTWGPEVEVLTNWVANRFSI